MKKLIFCVAINFLFLSISCGQNTGIAQYKLSKDATAIDGGYTFLIIGDWGRNGHYNQREVGDRMNEAVEVLDAEFIISTGDNFYDEGVASVDDPYWMSSFESIYDGVHLFLPWYAILGNHDYKGNAQAQIDYSEKSRRWHMPARYYSFDKTADDGAVATFIFIDTNPLELKYYKEVEYSKAVSEQDTTRQFAWIDSVLTASANSDWVIVSGHHPLYSGGKRLEETSDVRRQLEPVFKKHKVDIYFAGHEHDLQHIKAEGPTHYFVSGAGSEVRPTGKMKYSLFAASKPGFMSASFTKEKMLIQAIDHEGDVIYRTEILNQGQK